MKILKISTDRKLFEEKSVVLERMKDVAKEVKELHIVVLTTNQNSKLKDQKVGNLSIYPTNSMSRWLYIWDAYVLGKSIISKSHIDVISCQDPFETGIPGVFLKRKFHIPIQLEIHTDFLSPYFRDSMLNRIRVLLARYTIPKANGIRVVSEPIKNSLETYFPHLKVTPSVLPILADTTDGSTSESIRKKFSQFDHLVLMVSRLSPEKRIDIAFKVFKKFLYQFPKAGLIIVGDGPLRKNLELLANDLSIASSVIFEGWQKDTIPYFKGADLFLSTSEFEGYGLTLVEAAFHGCPIVTTEVGIAKTSLFETGSNSYVCHVGDVECLYKNIISLCTDSSKREMFASKMQEKISRELISKEVYIQKYIKLLQDLIK